MKKLIAILYFSILFSATTQAKITLSYGMQEQPGNNIYKAVVAMNDKLKEISHNEMELKIFPSSQLGDYRAMTEQVMVGDLDITINGYPDMSYMIPELKLIGEPYVVSDYDHLLKIIQSDYGKKMEQAFNKLELKMIDVWYYGMRQTTTNKAINKMEDLKGLKIRTPNVDFLLDYAKAVGAIPVPVAFSEVYLALQTNQVDGQENPLPTIADMKFTEVQKYIAMTNHFVASKAQMINLKKYNSLTPEQQGWLNEASQYAMEINNKMMLDDEKNLIEKFKSQGVTITYPDTKPFRAAMSPFYKKLETQFGKGSIDALINVN